MIRKIFNWTFRDVITFLRDNGFVQHNIEGSHFYYTKSIKKGTFIVCVPFHGAKTIKPKTLKSIIEQSGIDRNKWFR